MASKTRSRARKGEGDRLRTEILAAAEELLAVEGSVGSVSVRAIADAVGCTSPAIYMHWRHKEEIFTEVCSTRFAEFSSQVLAGLDGDGSVLDRLADVARAYVRFAEEYPEHYRVLFMGAVEAPPADAPPTPGALALGLVASTLEAGIETGEISPLDPTTTAVALFAAIHGVASLIVDRHEDIPVPSPEQLVEAVLSAVFNGISTARHGMTGAAS